MKRTDDDSWDLASSVGVTATMVAAARAVASREENPLIDDPFAAALVRAVGIEYFTKFVDGDIDPAAVDDSGGARMLTDVMAVRTRFFDDFFREATAAGVRQAVILASGLDSRAYRLPWPAGTVVFEIDQAKVIEFKSETLAALGASPPRTAAPSPSTCVTIGRPPCAPPASTTPRRPPGARRACWSICRRMPRIGCWTTSPRCPRRAAGWPPSTTPTPAPESWTAPRR